MEVVKTVCRRFEEVLMKTLVIAEKPSVAQDIVRAITPTELALFAHAIAGLQAVQGCIEAEVTALRKPAVSALSAF